MKDNFMEQSVNCNLRNANDAHLQKVQPASFTDCIIKSRDSSLSSKQTTAVFAT